MPPSSTPARGAPAGATRGGRPTPGESAADPLSTWRGWWLVNDRALLPARLQTLGTTTPTLDARTEQKGRMGRRREAVRREIVPALRRLLDPEARVDDLLRRTGLLALGKLGLTEEDAALIVAWLVDDAADLAVREAAALAVGLLRRSEPELQLDAHALDGIRARLVRVVDDDEVPETVRATCAISLGLLGDQPFGTGIHHDGRLVTAQIWRALGSKPSSTDLTVARLTALGMQPAAGVPDGVREGLRDVVYGRRDRGRRWSDLERGHALAALVRLGSADALQVPRRILVPQRTPVAVRRAALIGLGRTATAFDAKERQEAAGLIRQAIHRAKDPQTRGLAWIAVGRLVGAHVDAGEPLVRDLAVAWEELLGEARSGSHATRGYAILGLGVAARSATPEASQTRPQRRVRREAQDLLLAGLAKRRTDADLRGAHAIALGIAGSTRAVRPLTECVEDRHEVDHLRSDAAIALGNIQLASPEVVRALQLALSERKRPRVQAGAALSLSLLRGPTAGSRLLRELEHASSSTDVLRITEPLGHLGDPSLARPLVTYVLDAARAAYPRASMIVALGNLGDPEPRPSLSLLGEDANYPDAPATLRDALTTR